MAQGRRPRRDPDEVRNNGQRTMDAIFELCTGLDALTHEPLPADDGPRGSRRCRRDDHRSGCGGCRRHGP